MTPRRLLVRVMVVMLCLTAGVAIVVLVGGTFDDTTDRILFTTLAVSFFSLLAVPSATLLEQRRAPALARASATLAGLAFAGSLVLVWSDYHSSNMWRLWGVLLALALGTSQATIVVGRRRPADSRAVVRLAAAALLTGSVLSALAVVGILARISDQGFFRFLGALLVLDVLVMVLQAVLRRGAAPAPTTYRLEVDGRTVEATGRDFAAAVANVIREAERSGPAVQRIVRLG